MDGNLPEDPKNSKNKSSTVPPPFGSNFNPHVNPIDPNNPYATKPITPAPSPAPAPPPPAPQSELPQPPEHLKAHAHILSTEEKHKLAELAKRRERDKSGHFASHSKIPAIIEVNANSEPSDKKDPPLFGLFITNPVTYLKLFLNRLIRRQAITLRIPVLALVIIMAGIGGFGVGFQSGLNWALFRLFPNYSPILHRAITEGGIISKNNKGEYFLKSDNKKIDRLWSLKSVSANVKLEDYVNKQVQIKGNLTKTPDLIEVSEVISFETASAETASANLSSSPLPQIPDENVKAPSADTGEQTLSSLPALFAGLNWKIPKNKTLTFTSGTRKIEQEVSYIESLQSSTYPSDFISYYTQQLSNSGFKQTLNTQEPNNTSFTYTKGNLFLTFGVKNIYLGSGDQKQLVGYKAYIEHN